MRHVALFLILAIALLSTVAYAATVSVSMPTYQAQNGVYYQVTGYLNVVSNGFFVAQSSSAASSQPCTWSAGGTCTTALTAGDWYYSVTISITANTPSLRRLTK